MGNACWISPHASAPPACQGAAEPAGLDEEQRRVLGSEGRLLLQLLDNSAMEDFQLPIK